jgi:hypothetical protein
MLPEERAILSEKMKASSLSPSELATSKSTDVKEGRILISVQ